MLNYKVPRSVKIDARAIKGKLVSFEGSIYRIQLPLKRKVIRSSNVSFSEPSNLIRLLGVIIVEDDKELVEFYYNLEARGIEVATTRGTEDKAVKVIKSLLNYKDLLTITPKFTILATKKLVLVRSRTPLPPRTPLPLLRTPLPPLALQRGSRIRNAPTKYKGYTFLSTVCLNDDGKLIYFRDVTSMLRKVIQAFIVSIVLTSMPRNVHKAKASKDQQYQLKAMYIKLAVYNRNGTQRHVTRNS